MTLQIAVKPDMEADIRWRDWEARGAANDRRTDARMRTLMLLLVAVLVVLLAVQLT